MVSSTINEFNKGVIEGQQDTKNALKSIKEGRGISNNYAFKLSKLIFSLSFIVGVIAFIALITKFHFNIFTSLIVSLIIAWIALVVFGMGIGYLMLLIAKSNK